MALFSCPGGCDLKGDPIDPKHFDPALHDTPDHERYQRPDGRCFCLPYGDLPESERFYSRVIGVIDPGRDRIVQWLCPDCGWRWDR